jgi:putative ABC transport system ATP-binding protein
VVLNIRGLSHAYARAKRLVFTDVTLSAGEIGLVRGSSGAGKSTLMHLIVGAIQVATGHGAIDVAGQAMHTKPAEALDAMRPRIIGWMPQRVHLLPSLSVVDNLLLPLAMTRKLTPDESVRAQALMTSAGIASLATQHASDISVGQAARVCLVRALLASPQLLVADEPTASLDEKSARDICRMITTYANKGGCVLLASHDPAVEKHLRDEGATRISIINVSNSATS